MFRRMSKTKKALGALLFIAVFALGIALVMLLWNALIPQIVGWVTINYWQAAGLMILCRLLFGGFRNFGWNRHHHHQHFDRRKHGHLYEQYKDETKGMSREERRDYIRGKMRQFHPMRDEFDQRDSSFGHPSND